MEQHIVKIISIDKITHDVLQIVTKKPLQYTFTPGQATHISINKIGWEDQKKPFTFTSLPDQSYLQFTIKTYPAHNGVTNQLLKLKIGDELILHEIFGSIAYKGQGIFIAGGAGITPFISIFRFLYTRHKIGNNKLIFANKTKSDIILEAEFTALLGNNFINILSDEKVQGYAYGQINEDLIIAANDDANKMYYVCGPPQMMDAIEKQLTHLYIDPKSMVKEFF